MAGRAQGQPTAKVLDLFAGPPEANPSAAAASTDNRPARRASATTQGRGFQRNNSRHLDRSIVGKRVRVFWEDDQVWYLGVVKDYNRVTELHFVQFDDGDQREEPLNFPAAATWELE
eukprot:scaffold76635_cov63-Phaeocystis_antarctica.AAC.1